MDEGLVILLVGMFIVYLSLLLLFAVFQYVMPVVLRLIAKRPKLMAEAKPVAYTSGEQMAAVTAAIFLFLEETHDEENAIITIDKVSKSYSPWSSKIYTTHRFNNR